ncbi:MAG TPA: class I SAM-dependent methyltransferase, partial [Candidatus Limnocylindrales bacterium]
YGAGRGALAAAIVAGLRAEESPLLEALRYQPVELNEHRRAELRRRLADADAADHLAEPTEAAFTGAVIANEFLDALPVHRVEWRAGGLLEVHVDWEEDGPVDRLGPPSSAALAARLAAEGVTLEEGQRAEICLALDGWVAEVGAVLKRGYVLVIDYGHPASELYASRRRAGTLLAYREHGVEEDPYGAIGHQDLTSHVDLTALERAAAAHGLAALGSTSQAEFLVGIGAADILARWRADPAASLAGYAELRAALRRMLDPRVTGGFRVVAFGRRVPAEPALAGFGFAIDPGARGSARRSER